MVSIAALSISAISFALLLMIWQRLPKSGQDSQSTILEQLNKLEKSLQSFEIASNLKQDTQNQNQEKLERHLREELARNRDESQNSHKQAREELAGSIKELRDSLSLSVKSSSETNSNHLTQITKLQNDQLTGFSERLKEMRSTIESSIKNLQDENTKKLDEMRHIVDEKLQTTLEKRIQMSFKEVSDRLEQVHKGLGEMQNLAIGVGDLKKVLSNVKTRGTWGEYQLANLLEQIMSPDQYSANVATKPSSQERVDFAIKLPGASDEQKQIWLPIDAKFPQEDYQRLIEAQESANPELAEAASKQLEARIKLEAKSIKEKYIEIPYTTDFALLFLPTEGLYAEVIRRPGLMEKLQNEFRVNIVGPTTLAALLNSLQIGFRTLAIQKHSGDVLKALAEINKHFGVFGELLIKAHEKVNQAGKVIEDAGKRYRTVESKLLKAQKISTEVATDLLIELGTSN